MDWQLDHADEVGRVTGRGESTETLKSLVDGAVIGVLDHDVLSLGRLHPDEGHLGVEDLGVRLFKDALLRVPSAAFEVKTPDVGAIRCWLLFVELSLIHDLVIPRDQIDGDSVLPSIVLLETGEETLGEVEARNPEVGRLALVDPRLNEVESLNEVDNVAGKWLERGVRPLGPGAWDLVVEQAVTDLFELTAHHNFTLDGELDVLERASDDIE